MFAIQQEAPRELKKVTEKPRLLFLRCKGRISPRLEGVSLRPVPLPQILPPRETVALPESSHPRSSFLSSMVLARTLHITNHFGGADLGP